jgi:uncharacterized protein YbjQ (UPF0145 family)
MPDNVSAMWRRQESLNVMRISFTDEIDGGRILYPIGRVRAAASWRGGNLGAEASRDKDAALRALIETATDVDADAIVGVGFEVDGVSCLDLTNVDLKRVTATGVAVKLARN